jgi:hypothetical protein
VSQSHCTCGYQKKQPGRFAELFAAVRAFSWIPITAAVFLLGWENVVAVTLLYSAYANFESGIAAWMSGKAARKSS